NLTAKCIQQAHSPVECPCRRDRLDTLEAGTLLVRPVAAILPRQRGKPRGNTMDMKGKVALITGASRGMGKQMALRLAKHGVNVVLAARTVESGQSEWPGSLKQTEQEIRALGVDCLPVRCDLTQRKDVENLCRTALDKFGRVDILLNNARYVGPGHFDPFLALDIDTWEKNVDTNLMAPVIASRMCIPGMIKNKYGMIICTTSGAATGRTGIPGKGGMAMHY